MPDIDLTHQTPPEGRHDAVIEAINLKRSGWTWLGIYYRIPHKGEDFFLWEELPIAVPPNSPGYQRTAEGKGRIHEILSAFGEQPPAKIFAPDLEDALLGREVYLEIRHQQKGTFRTPWVVAVLGKARRPVPAPASVE